MSKKEDDADDAPKAAPIDPALIRELAQILADTELTEIEIKQDGLKLRLARQTTIVAAAAPQAVVAAPAAPAARPAAAAAAEPEGERAGAVKSPMVGTAYRRPNPDAKPFVEVGSQVKAGERLLLVEAMKTFNDIVAPRAGTIVEIMIEDGQPVEYGQTLLVIE